MGTDGRVCTDAGVAGGLKGMTVPRSAPDCRKPQWRFDPLKPLQLRPMFHV
jgi:hypothetical protein